MRKLVVTEFLSLDGVMENPMWSMAYWSDETAKFKGDEGEASDALQTQRVCDAVLESARTGKWMDTGVELTGFK